MSATRRDGTPSSAPQPARGYSWPPFEPGHTASVRHGAHSERLVSERASAILEELREQYVWLVEADALVVQVLVESKARLEALNDYVTGIIAGTTKAYPLKGRPTTGVEAVPERIWQQISRESRTVLDAASKLGFTPRDRAELARDTGVAAYFGGRDDALRAFAAEGRKLRQLRGRGV